METPVQIQQKAIVKIVNKTGIGTGILILPQDEKHVYVVTAKHLLLGKDFSSELNKSEIIIDNIFNASNEFISYQIKETDRIVLFDNNDDDIAIITIPRSEIELNYETLTKINYIDSDYGLWNCSVRGFPNLGSSDSNIKSRSLTCLFDEFKAGNSNHFLIHTQQHLDTFFSDANSNVQGLSGGSVFFNYDKKSYLLGMVMEYAPINSFSCISIGRINTLLKESNLPIIPITALIVDEKVNATIIAFKKNEASLKAKINTTIGDLHLTRLQTGDAMNLIRQNQLLLLYGNAGVGKSSFARETITKLNETDEFELFLFNGEQFSNNTINDVLQHIGAQQTIGEIITDSGFKKEKIFWIESVEKLIEVNHTEAFNELLELAKKNSTIKIVITIRNYLFQQFFLRFGWNLPATKGLLEVPLLSDDELAVVSKHFPALKSLLSNSKIIHLLRIPFYLNYAVAILPALNESSDLDEQTFKSIIWDNVIDNNNDDRGIAFESLCVKRAKEMSLFTSIDVSKDIIQSLYRDNLISIEDDELKEQYAPSHDVLEDWALIRFIKRHKKKHSSAKDFLAAVGNKPAIRRAFRLWLGEELQHYDKALKNFIQEAIENPDIDKYWKDEIYISVLRSDFSAVFFTENEELLLKNDGYLILKFIQLLKTACKEPASGFANVYFPILTGSGWGSVVEFLYKHKEQFIKYDVAVISFLLEWKSKMYNGGFNFPPESRDAGLLLLTILDRIKSNYNGNINRQSLDSYIEQGIRLSFTFAKVITAEIEDLLLSAQKDSTTEVDRPNYHIIGFYKKILQYAVEGIYSIQLCIYMPELLIDILKTIITPKAREKRSSYYDEDHPKVEEQFGLQYNFEFRFSPASSYQTPVYYLLKNHPFRALDFIVEIVNNSTQVYQKSVKYNTDEVIEIELTLNDGSKVKQRGSPLLWQMYRGTGNTPEFLQSVLMALEKYLFELAENEVDENKELLRAIYDFLYRTSTSVAISSVLASVGLRFPKAVGEAMLPLLSLKHTIQWDGIRFINEQPRGLNLFKDKNDIHDNERIESDLLPHRNLFKGLSQYIIDHLLYDQSFKKQIFNFLDAFHEEAKADKDIFWLKTLSEIDIRKWQVTTVQEQPGKAVIAPQYEGKVKEFLEEGLPQRQQANVEAGYSSWIDKAYKKDTAEKYLHETWKSLYIYYTTQTIAESLFAKPGTLAVLGLRDFTSQLTAVETQWCINAIYSGINNTMIDRAGHDYSLQRSLAYNLMDLNPCLSFLPFLFPIIKTKKGLLELKKIFLTIFLSGLHEHELKELLTSMRYSLWSVNKDFTKQCVYFLTKYASLLNNNRGWRGFYGNQDTTAKDRAVKRLINSTLNKEINEIDFSEIELNNYTHWYLLLAFIIIPADIKEDNLANYCIILAQMHIDNFDSKNDRSDNFFQDRSYIQALFPEVLLYLDPEKAKKTADILFDAYNSDKDAILRYQSQTKKQEFINKVIENIIRSIDTKVGSKDEKLLITHFWNLWNRFHKRNLELTSYYFASILLLEIPWKDEARNWVPIDGRNSVLQEFIKYYGEVDLSAAVSLISTIGNKELMPEGISLIAEILRKSPYMKVHLNMLAGIKFIQSCFYDQGLTIKKNSLLLNDFILILDIMVDTGSTEAYLIRENLITFKAA